MPDQSHTTDERHICDYPICSERGSGHPLACNCRSASAPPRAAKTDTVAIMDPLDTPLPCDVKCGSVVFRKGVKLRVLADAAERWRAAAAPHEIAKIREAISGK